MNKPTVVSLFAGCGGSSLGYKMAGGDVRLAVEWDPAACATYRANWPEAQVYEGDVHALTGEEACRRAGVEPGELDVLDGSPPCQGFSISGKRRMEDQRSTLFQEYVRLLRHLRPKALVMENVKGMVLGKMKAVYRRIMGEIWESGYDAEAAVLDASWFGVPQRRERTIIVGVRSDLVREGKALPPSHPVATGRPVTMLEALRGIQNDSEEVKMLLAFGEKYRSYSFFGLVKKGKRGCEVTEGINFSFRKTDPLRSCYTLVRFMGNAGVGELVHWAEKRRFTVAESKRLCSFPDGFIFPDAGSREKTWSKAIMQMGNCVPPRLMEAVARHVFGLIRGPVVA